MRTTRSNLDRVKRNRVKWGTCSQSGHLWRACGRVQALATTGSRKKIWEEVLSLSICLSISQLTSNCGPFSRMKREIYFYKEVFHLIIEVVNHLWLFFACISMRVYNIQSFPSPRPDAIPKLKIPVCPTIYLKLFNGKRIIGFIPFPRAIVLCKKQSHICKVFTKEIVSKFYFG